MYVQALETNYNDTIRDLKLMLDKEKSKSKRANFERVNEVTQKNELENLICRMHRRDQERHNET